MDLLSSGVIDIAGPWDHRWIAANGARFHTAQAGSGPLVVFLHGFPEFWWAWRHQLPAVAEAGWRVVAMDLRGYGGSDKTPRGYDPFTLASDVAGVIRSLGESSATLVGHGWGGYVAWATAALYPRYVNGACVISAPHPLRLRRALLRDGRQLSAARHVLGYQAPIVPERRLMANGAAHVEELLRRWSAPGSAFPNADEARRYRAAMQLWPAPHCALEYYRWLVRSTMRPDGRRFARLLREPVAVPVLQLHGGHDQPVRSATAQSSAEHVDGPYRWHVIDDAGHFPHEETPREVTDEVLAWLGSTVTSPDAA